MKNLILSLLLFLLPVSVRADNLTGLDMAGTLFVKKNDKFTYSLSGTWVGRIILESTRNGGQSWNFHSVYSTNTSGEVITDDADQIFRFRVDSYTSGTIVATITAGSHVPQSKEFYNSLGQSVGRITETGIEVDALNITNGTLTLSGSGSSLFSVDSGGTTFASALRVTGTTPTTSATTGAAVISGGLGLGSSLFAAGALKTLLGIVGISDGSNAGAGYVGEYVSANSSTNTTIGGTSTQWWDAGSLLLQPGDWDLEGAILYDCNGGTIAELEIGVNTTTGNSAAGTVNGQTLFWHIGTWINDCTAVTMVLPSVRVNPSTPTRYYLKGYAQYTVAQPKYRYSFSARRVR